MIRMLSLLVPLSLLIACGGYQMEYGIPSQTGVVFYPLCERSQQRIMDLNRLSFDMPIFVKNSPCRNWPDYKANIYKSSISIEFPSSINMGDKVLIGGHLGFNIVDTSSGRCTTLTLSSCLKIMPVRYMEIGLGIC